MALRTLTIPVKGIYFDQIKHGQKKIEYRLRTDFWIKRLTALAGDHFRNARRLSEVVVARDAQIAKLQADGNKLAGALEAFQRHYDLNDCDERCGALEVPISDLRRARQALTEWKDRA